MAGSGLYPEATWIPSPSFGYPKGTSGREGYSVISICNHIAQGPRSAVRSWFAGDNEASAHFLVGRDGKVDQYVSLNDAAWANGQMDKPDTSILWINNLYKLGVNPNLVTVSIEHEGYSGTPLTKEQYDATLSLHLYLVKQYKLVPAFPGAIIGHYQIDSVNRPNCPGSAFPREQLIRDLQALLKERPETMSEQTKAEVLKHFDYIWGASNQIEDMANEMEAQAKQAKESARIIKERLIAAKRALGFE